MNSKLFDRLLSMASIVLSIAMLWALPKNWLFVPYSCAALVCAYICGRTDQKRGH